MRFPRIVAAILIVILLLALGAGVYQAGLAAGAAGAAGGAASAAVPYRWFGWYGFGPGFGLFHLFGFLLAIVLVALLFRALLWGGRRHRDWGPGDGPGWRGAPDGGWEQRMREYHDRLHAPEAAPRANEPRDQRAGG